MSESHTAEQSVKQLRSNAIVVLSGAGTDLPAAAIAGSLRMAADLIESQARRIAELEKEKADAIDPAHEDFDFTTMSNEHLATCLERVHPFNTFGSIMDGCEEAARRLRVPQPPSDSLKESVELNIKYEALLHYWLRDFGSTNDLSQRTRAALTRTGAVETNDGPDTLVHALELLRQQWSHNVNFEATIGACKDEIELCIERAAVSEEASRDV